jgi:hypothetical protein
MGQTIVLLDKSLAGKFAVSGGDVELGSGEGGFDDVLVSVPRKIDQRKQVN